MATDDSQMGPFTADSALTKEEIEQRNLEVVAAHFHNENPDDVDKAIALYAPDICWEAPNRGVVYTDAQEVKDACMGIFRTLVFRKFGPRCTRPSAMLPSGTPVASQRATGHPHFGYLLTTSRTDRLVMPRPERS